MSDTKVRVYISGPITGYPNENRDAFAYAAWKLREQGFEVVSPFELPPLVLKPNDEEYNWRQHMARDVAKIISGEFHMIVLLDGWEKSEGSLLEVSVAQYLGIKVFRFKTILDSIDSLKKKGTEK